MGDLEHQHHHFTILDITDQPVVAHAITPQPREICSQPLASLPGVLRRGSVELLELPLGGLRDPKRPGQALPSRR